MNKFKVGDLVEFDYVAYAFREKAHTMTKKKKSFIPAKEQTYDLGIVTRIDIGINNFIEVFWQNESKFRQEFVTYLRLVIDE